MCGDAGTLTNKLRRSDFTWITTLIKMSCAPNFLWLNPSARLSISSEVAGHALPLFAVSAKITLRGGLFYLLLAPLAFSYLFLATDLYHHARFGGLLSLVEWWILHMTILYSFGMINVFTTTYNFQGPHPKFPASRQMSKILGSALRCLRLCGAKKVSATGIWKFFLEKKSCSDHIAPTYNFWGGHASRFWWGIWVG